MSKDTLYQIFEFEEGLDAKLVNEYITDRGFAITIPLGRETNVPKEMLRAYGYPPREGYKKLLCFKRLPKGSER